MTSLISLEPMGSNTTPDFIVPISGPSGIIIAGATAMPLPEGDTISVETTADRSIAPTSIDSTTTDSSIAPTLADTTTYSSIAPTLADTTTYSSIAPTFADTTTHSSIAPTLTLTETATAMSISPVQSTTTSTTNSEHTESHIGVTMGGVIAGLVLVASILCTISYCKCRNWIGRVIKRKSRVQVTPFRPFHDFSTAEPKGPPNPAVSLSAPIPASQDPAIVEDRDLSPTALPPEPVTLGPLHHVDSGIRFQERTPSEVANMDVPPVYTLD